jgi:hypothetical protein
MEIWRESRRREMERMGRGRKMGRGVGIGIGKERWKEKGWEEGKKRWGEWQMGLEMSLELARAWQLNTKRTSWKMG